MDPTFNIEGLQPYIKQNRDEMITRFLLKGKTLDRISIRDDIKTSEAIHYMDVDIDFQDGRGCGFNPDGKPVDLVDRVLETALIKVDKEFCPDDLLGSYAEALVKLGVKEADLPFEEYIVELIVNKIERALEFLIWQGDTESDDTKLKWIDGFLARALGDDEAATIKVEMPYGTSAYELIKAVYMAMPEEIVDKEGAAIHVQPSIFREFMQEMVAKNLYHYPSAEEKELEEFYFPGSGVKVVKTLGLTGTNVVYATFDRNMVYGCDKKSRKNELDVDYDKKAGTFYLKARFNAGVITYFPDWVVIGGVSANPYVAVEKVELDETAVQVDLNGAATKQLAATVTPADATAEVEWESNDESVATVDETGLVTGVAVGVAAITAKAGGKSASCAVTVVNTGL